jgi:enolase
MKRSRPQLLGLDVINQELIDRTMIALDGSPINLLGCNAILAVSLASAKAGGGVSRIAPLPLSGQPLSQLVTCTVDECN